MVMPLASASRRSRRIVLRLRDDQGGEEVVETAEAGIVPVELLVGALQEAAVAERAPLRLGHEGHMGRGSVAQFGELHQALRQRRPERFRRRRLARTRKRRPVAGVNGTATCSFG